MIKKASNLLSGLFTVPRFFRFNAILGFIGHNIYQYFPFILPHEKSYYGFLHLIEKGEGLFLDVGANDGISALGFRRLNQTYRILSLEPNHLLAPRLKRLKKSLAKFDYKIIGAGRQKYQKTLYTPFYRGIPIHTAASCHLKYAGNSMAFQFPKAKKEYLTYHKQTVNIVRLDTLKLNPDIIKIDAEGFDYDALLGATQTIKKSRPFIMLEFHPDLVISEMKLLRCFKYSFYFYNHTNKYFYMFDPEKEIALYGLSNFSCW